jgi:hypothetical protein
MHARSKLGSENRRVSYLATSFLAQRNRLAGESLNHLRS